jgi:hypothetical protein
VHHLRDPYQPASSVALLHLTVDQLRRHLPPEDFPSSATQHEPLTKVSGEGIEVEIEPVTREKGDATRSQDLSQGVDHGMGCILCARTELKHRNSLGEGIDG